MTLKIVKTCAMCGSASIDPDGKCFSCGHSMPRKQQLQKKFADLLKLAKEALVLKYGSKDAAYIVRAFNNDPAEIIALAARDLLRKEPKS